MPNASPLSRLGLGAVCAALTWFAHTSARADLSDCGNIELRTEIDCTVVPPSAQCQAMCTPISVQAACHAKLAVDCDGQCTQVPSVDCTGSCQAGCTGECTIDPGKFQCQARCQADCSGQCESSCESKSDKDGCMASCSGSCTASCKGSCDVDLPQADCDGQCMASCKGSCTVNPNLDCQIDCQAKGYAECQTSVTGGCEASCKAKQGALFCDGNYVDTGDNLQKCVDTLKAAVNAHVSGMASGSSECDAGSCTAKGSASAKTKCSVTSPGAHEAGGAFWGVLAMLGAALVVRRRRG
jgi:MYXO-CTERM domain-containing protein